MWNTSLFVKIWLVRIAEFKANFLFIYLFIFFAIVWLVFYLESNGVRYIMIWLVVFEKKSFMREIWIHFEKLNHFFLGLLSLNGNLTSHIRSLDKISWKRNFHRLCAACASLLKHSSHQRRTHCASAQCGNFFWQLRFSS